MSLHLETSERRERLGLIKRLPVVMIRAPRAKRSRKIKPAGSISMAPEWTHASAPEWKQTIARVAVKLNVLPEIIMRPRRAERAVWAQQICAWMLRHYFKCSFVDIANKLQARDHAAAYYSARRCENMIDEHRIPIAADWREMVDALTAYPTNMLRNGFAKARERRVGA